MWLRSAQALASSAGREGEGGGERWPVCGGTGSGGGERAAVAEGGGPTPPKTLTCARSRSEDRVRVCGCTVWVGARERRSAADWQGLE